MGSLLISEMILSNDSSTESSSTTTSSSLSDVERQLVCGYGETYLNDMADVQRLARVHLNCTGLDHEPQNLSSQHVDNEPSLSHNGLSSFPSFPRAQLAYDKYSLLPAFAHVPSTVAPLQDPTREIEGLSTEKALDYSDCPSRNIVSKNRIHALMSAHPLPPLTTAKWRRDTRFIYWSVYRRLWALIVLINISAIAALIWQPFGSIVGLKYQQAATGTAANFIVAALARQEHVVNLLFRLACLLPRKTPLCLRKQVAHVYSHGGLHSGCGVSAFFWYVCFTVLLIKQFKGTVVESAVLGPTTAIILAILLLVLITSHPYIRKRWHKHWELSHRYGGWTAITLSWGQTIITVIDQCNEDHQSIGIGLVESPNFWVLSVISVCLVYPWTRLRRRKVEAEQLSNHAVRLWFDDKKLPTCVGHRFATAPLAQNPGFSTIPNSNDEQGYSIIVPDAGEWSKDLIQNPPDHIWTRGAPTKGVLRIATLFQPIVVVATGSGIGTCLSFLQTHPDYPMRIIWFASSPESTYGCKIMGTVFQADDEAIIVDSDKTGPPDLVALTYALYRESKAEAVVVISKAEVTKQLVYEMEIRSIAAFGPIFDA